MPKEKKSNNTPENNYSLNSKILTAAQMLPKVKAKNGEGRAAEAPAKQLGVSLSTMYQAKSVLNNASEKDLQDVKDGKKSIKKTYIESRPSRPVSSLKKAVDILEKYNYRVLKIEEDFSCPNDFKGALNLIIVPKET